MTPTPRSSPRSASWRAPELTPIYETGGPIYTVQQMGTMTVDVAKSLGQLPVKVFGVGKAIVGLEERDPNGPVSVVGGGRLAGEVASHDEFPLKDKSSRW